MKYAYPVKKMCQWLDVSASGFFDWKRREKSATTRRREELTTMVVEIFKDSDETYGYRRVHAELAVGACRPVSSWSARSCATRAWCLASLGRGGRA